MSQKLQTWGKAFLFFFLPLLVFGWTSVPVFALYTLHLGVVALLVGVALAFAKSERLQLFKVVLQVLIVLLLVGGTGWFLSPFFFLLYLVPIYLGFIYASRVAFGFLAGLLIIFASSVGEVDLAFDIMTLLSLLLVIPLVIYLRKKYLVIRQTTKDILILEDESAISDTGTISRLLSNRVTSLGVNVRQPLTFINQATALLLEGNLTNEEAVKQLQRIRTTAIETLDMVRKFEGDTSANRVLTNTAEGTNQGKTVAQPTI